MKTSHRMGVIVSLMLGAAGCEHGVDGAGSIQVPDEVQQLFSAEQPGQVAVRVDRPGRSPGPVQVVGYLCGPDTGPAVLRFSDFYFDCAEEAVLTVHAWAAPPAAPVSSDRCGQRDPSAASDPPTDPEDAVAYASGQTAIVISDSIGKCNDGSYRFELTLQPGRSGGAPRADGMQ